MAKRNAASDRRIATRGRQITLTPIKPALTRTTDPFEDQIGVQSMPPRDRRNRRARRHRLIDNPLAFLETPRPAPPANTFLRRRHLVFTSSMVDT
jgi:hypothetical protein